MASIFSLRSLFRPLVTASSLPKRTTAPPLLATAVAAAPFSTTTPRPGSKKPRITKSEATRAKKTLAKQAAVKAAARAKRQAAMAKLDPKTAGLMRFIYSASQIQPPLRMGRQRHLRHMTIHRAWQLWQRQRAEAQERELMKLQQSMSNACEVLRNLGGPGSRPVGWLYRVAMQKVGVWSPKAIPIEYARPVVETPGEKPWNHEWKRPFVKGNL